MVVASRAMSTNPISRPVPPRARPSPVLARTRSHHGTRLALNGEGERHEFLVGTSERSVSRGADFVVSLGPVVTPPTLPGLGSRGRHRGTSRPAGGPSVVE